MQLHNVKLWCVWTRHSKTNLEYLS